MDWSHFHFEVQSSNWLAKGIEATSDFVSKGLTTLQDDCISLNHRSKNVLIIGSGIAGLYFTVKAFSYYKKAQRR